MKTVILQNGKEFCIYNFSFTEKMSFKRIAFSIIQKSTNKDIQVAFNNSNINDLISIVAGIGASKEVDDFVFKCILTCIYDTRPITKEDFEQIEELQEAYVEMQIEVMKVLLMCFITPLLSVAKNHLPSQKDKIEENQQR